MIKQLFGVVLLVFAGIASTTNGQIPETTLSFDPVRYGYEFSEKAEGWLKLHEVPETWQNAKLRCHSEGAILASPLTVELKEAIISFVLNKTRGLESPKTIFTGVHASSYHSIEGVPLSRMPVTWAGDVNVAYDSCLVMDAENAGAVADTGCGSAFPFVCYKLKTETVLNECGTADQEYRMYKATGSCYKLHSTRTDWPTALSTCAGEGAHLAILNSGQEAQYLASLIEVMTYIGFNDGGSYGHEWKTIHGEPLAEAGYATWNIGEPNNSSMYHHGEYCGGMEPNGKINDMDCQALWPFMCEITTKPVY